MPTIRLLSTPGVEDQWREVAQPWLREQFQRAWRSPHPTVVLTPTRAEGFYLRSRLVDEGAPFLGLRFWTPSDARKFLLGALSPESSSATQSELRLLARACAENLPSQSASGTLASVLREPGPFLRAYDLLLGSGWDPARSGAAYGRALAEAFGQELAEHRIATQAGLHHELRRLASRADQEPPLASLLVLGFNAAHWPLWDLLRAMVSAAEEVTIALLEPRFFGESVDQLWIGSWEEETGLIRESLGGFSETKMATPFAPLAAAYEKGEPGEPGTTDLTFLVTPDLASQSRAIILQAIDYLKRDSCQRLGIVFAEANALALQVASGLRRLGLPLDDGTGALCPGIFERRGWSAWLALQEEPSVRRLVAWLRACEAEDVSSGAEELTAHEVAEVLDGALGQSLVDDLDFLARHLEESDPGHRESAVAKFLRSRLALPDTATFADFLATTRRALDLPGWAAHLEQLQTEPPAWLWKSERILSRRIFLEWLKESTDSRERIRGREGNHFYGKVHLLLYAQMSGQTWTHLILTGLNEGVWPRVFEGEAFGSRHELAALNQEARALNRRGTEQGGQGQGHETVRANRGYCLLPLDRQDLALRDLCAALEGTSRAVCLTAMTTDAGRSLLPGNFFNHAFLTRTGRPLDEETFRHQAHSTLAWCQRHEHLFAAEMEPESLPETLAATRIAYEARRDAKQSFGAYEFAYRTPPSRPIQLSCKRWEDAWHHPGTVWLNDIVGVSPWPEGTLAWPRAVGTWVHQWLMSALRECRERSAVTDFPALLRDAAQREAARTRRRARDAGIGLYPWWELVWGQARALALGLGETLAPHLRNGRFLSEYRLPDDIRMALPGSPTADFALTGRLDLLLFEPGDLFRDPASGDFSACRCWVIDFKTGSAPALNAAKMEKGVGLQAVLYALAIRAKGAGPTAISLHTADAPLARQVELDDALNLAGLFTSLDIMHRAGIFGMRGQARNDYGYSPDYPMATRWIPVSILEAKWALVHGGATVETEEES
jgi:hypothetical protein